MMIEPLPAAGSIGKIGDDVLCGDFEFPGLERSRFDETESVNVFDDAKQRGTDQTVPVGSCCYAEDD